MARTPSPQHSTTKYIWLASAVVAIIIGGVYFASNTVGSKAAVLQQVTLNADGVPTPPTISEIPECQTLLNDATARLANDRAYNLLMAQYYYLQSQIGELQNSIDTLRMQDPKSEDPIIQRQIKDLELKLTKLQSQMGLIKNQISLRIVFFFSKYYACVKAGGPPPESNTPNPPRTVPTFNLFRTTLR